jgi:DNA end-binding protein Ku
MARSVWSGTIEFGLVSIPVALSTATESKSIAFHQLHDKCGTRIKEQRYCPHCERVVEYGEIEKGYEYSKGRYVKLTKDDLEKLPLPSKKVIVLDNFVKQEEIDPIYFDGTYYAEPDKAAERPYSLLLETLKKKKLVAIGTLALRNKERLCCIRVYEESLVVEVLLYPDEIRQHAEHKLSSKVSEKELAVADHLVDIMSGEFEPEKYTDHYREAVSELIESKLEGQEEKGEEIQRPRGGGKVLDLMAALQASLDSAQGSSKSSKARSEEKPSRSNNSRARKSTREQSEETGKSSPVGVKKASSPKRASATGHSSATKSGGRSKKTNGRGTTSKKRGAA